MALIPFLVVLLGYLLLIGGAAWLGGPLALIGGGVVMCLIGLFAIPTGRS